MYLFTESENKLLQITMLSEMKKFIRNLILHLNGNTYQKEYQEILQIKNENEKDAVFLFIDHHFRIFLVSGGEQKRLSCP